MKKYLNINTVIAGTISLTLLMYALLRSTDAVVYMDKIIVYVTIFGTIPTLYNIIVSTYKKQFGVDFIALLAIVSTLLLNEHIAGAIILLMLSGGESLEKYAEGQAKNALEKLLRFAPTKAHRTKKGLTDFEDITVQEINIGDTLLIKRGEVTPVDGVVVSGNSSIDESMITGEPMPRDVKIGSKVWSGSINTVDVLYITTTTNHEQSTFSAIIRLVAKAQEKKAPTVRLANKFSVIFTAITLVIAVIAWFIDPKLVVAVLVVATPCPLILAAPIAFIAGMSRSAKRGIVVKHGGVFENITKAHSYFFDKTGTLTFGVPQVKEIKILKGGAVGDTNTDNAVGGGAGGATNTGGASWTEDKILALSASIEQFSTHILSQSIVTYANEKKLDLFIPEKFEETIGQGISGLVRMDGQEIKVTDGNSTLLKSMGITITEEAEHIITESKNNGEMAVYIAVNNIAVAVIIFSDKIRDDISPILNKIKETGAEIVLVTGDAKERAEKIGKELGFTKIIANCLPENKMDLVQKYESEGKMVVMIGDGVNDAPAIGRASVGIALGYHGATTSTDTADAIITSDNTSKILELTEISRKTVSIAFQSIFIGMALSIIAMIFALFGYIKPISGAILQEVIDILVILNALRALND
jgi:heavy metal translocating P-type ATPase